MRIDTLRRHRINKVMNFARSCELEHLTLDAFADVACLSRSHFVRDFKNQCQESPVEFATRLRLEQSVSNLIYRHETSITEIAFEAGFASSQSFSNAFSRRFGMSPRKFRNRNRWYVTDRPAYLVDNPLSPSDPARTSRPAFRDEDVVIRVIPETRLAYLRFRGPYYGDFRTFDAVTSKLINWARRERLWRDDTDIIGVCPDNSVVTPPLFCQYDQGIAVEDGVVEDDVISIQMVPETVVATLEGCSTKDSWQWFLSEWLPRSGLRKSGHDYYEIIRWHVDCGNRYVISNMMCLPIEVDRMSLKKLGPDPLIADGSV